MSSREFGLTPAANAGPAPAHRAETPASRRRGKLQPSRAAVLPGGNSGSLAAALAQTGGGRLKGAGADLLQLQRAYGNRYVQRVVDQARAAPVIQASLLLGAAEDRYEREADRVAQQVAKGRAALAPDANSRPPAVQRIGGAGGGGVDASVQQAILGARCGGQPLPDGLRSSMEQALGADFRGVRVHADTRADSLSRALQARAFTTGQDLFFRRGEYNPFSRGGRHLLAHELTHVVQQSGTNDSQLLQRRVGYEFENTGIKLVKGNLEQYKEGYARAAKQFEGKRQWEQKILGTKYQNLARKEEVLNGTYFTLEADDTAGSNVEFVLHGPRKNKRGQEKAGFTFRQKQAVKDTAEIVSKLAQTIEEQKREPFYATDLDPNAEKGVIVHNLNPSDSAYLFQATAGIRLDKITEVFSNPSTVFERGAFTEDPIAKAKKAIAAADIPDKVRRNRLVNLLTLIIAYVDGARRHNGGNIKEISPIMARTDFARMFSLMPDVAENYLRRNLDVWVNLVCAATGSAADEPLSDYPDSPLNEITISAWARGMAKGEDLLKGIDPDKAMGGLGRRTDPGNPERENAPARQPIFEFRHMRPAWPSNFVELCETFFDYAAEVNKEKRVR
jgi:hypothetical protein